MLGGEKEERKEREGGKKNNKGQCTPTPIQ
jgi:hypothetical protein